MPQTFEVTVFKFNELDDKAKEKAREWYREGALNYDWWDSVYEDAERIAEILGIELKHRQEKQRYGMTIQEPCIWFSGFCS